MASRAWERLEVLVERLAAAGFRRPAPFLVVVALLAGAGFAGSTRLSLRADLIDLLPRSFASVRGLDELRDRFGGIGYGVVVGQSRDPDALRRFARDFAPKLERVEGVRFVDYQRPSAFFDDRSLYFMDLADLEEIQRRVEARWQWEKRQRNPLLIDLDPEPAPPLDFSDLEKKYESTAIRRLSGEAKDGDGGQQQKQKPRDPLLLDEQKGMVVLLAKPLGLSTDLPFSKRFVGKLESFFASQDLSAYGPDFKVSLTGTFKKKVDQQQQIIDDLKVTSVAAMVLLLLYLALHFRGLVAVFLDLVPVSVGLLWTYGFVSVVYGEVNILTAFLGAILGGLGTEHGIHLLGRYNGLLAEGHSPDDSVRDAFRHTGSSAIVSSLVAACTFASLSISEFKPFREFGVIAAVGMMLVVSACLLSLPAMLGLAVRLGWTPHHQDTVAGRRSRLAAWLQRAPLPFAAVVGGAVLLLVLNSPRVRFTYDLGVLQDMQLPSFRLDTEVNQILGYSQTPVIILTSSEEEERAVVQRLAERKRQLGAASTIDFTAALTDLVPPDQGQKRQILLALRRILERIDPAWLEDGELRDRYDELMRYTAARPFARDDIPASIRRQFEGVTPSPGGFIIVFPGVTIDDGANVRRLAREVRDIETPGGGQVSASGEAMILADILDMVTREALPVLLATVLMVIAAMWLTLGRLGTALSCLAPTLASVLALMGLLPLAGLEINFLNMVAIPVLVGTTVDAGVHLLSRLRDAGADFGHVVGETGRAIAGGLLTSAVGFAALVWADHPGLSSLGELTILGFAVNAAVMLVGFPATLLVAQRALRRWRR